MATRITPQLSETLAKEYLASPKNNTKTLAVKYGMAPSTVAHHLRLHGITPSRQGWINGKPPTHDDTTLICVNSAKRIRRIRNIHLIEQKGRCKICKVKFSKLVIPYLDHCHKTKKIRGVVCRPCNSGLGFFRDNKKYLQAAIDYLS